MPLIRVLLIRPRIPPGVGGGFALALALLALLNLTMLNEHVVHRYAAVFAVGRAMDKQLYLEAHPPQVLVIGNSRVDNGIDPKDNGARLGRDVFNLGIPGANARTANGFLTRLERAGGLGSAGVQVGILGLDESFLQAEDSLGYAPFFADRHQLLVDKDYATWLGSWLRLWSYSGNLRQLREPDKAIRFLEATLRPLEPMGGAAWRHHGYRAGFAGGGQNESQMVLQEQLAQRPPDMMARNYLALIIRLLHAKKIPVAVSFPPILNRGSAYVDGGQAQGAYLQIRDWLLSQGVTVISGKDSVPRIAEYFVNAGHLNDKGAQIYSDWLGHELQLAWAGTSQGMAHGL